MVMYNVVYMSTVNNSKGNKTVPHGLQLVDDPVPFKIGKGYLTGCSVHGYRVPLFF